MFKSFIRIAFRNLWKHKLFSFINIIGLATGISASIVIFLLVQYEFSYESFVPGADRVYRVVSNMKFPGNVFKNPGLPLPLIQAAAKDIAGLELVAKISTPNSEVKVSVLPDKQSRPKEFLKQEKIVFADQNTTKLFDYTWIAGNAESALASPFVSVLTASRAQIYFPQSSPADILGKIVTYNDTIHCTVAGIVENLKGNTDFEFDEFISYSTLEKTGFKNHLGWDQWGSVNSNNQLLVKLSSGIIDSNVRTSFQKLLANNQKEAYLDNEIKLQPLADVHFNSDYFNFSDRTANKRVLFGLIGVGLIILLLGCINFINLSTAKSVSRAREIGVRKSIGGSKAQLVFHFLGETGITTLAATLFSILLVPVLLKSFSDFIPDGVNMGSMTNPVSILFILGLVIIVSVLSGFYPALVLTRYKPVEVLKNQIIIDKSSGGREWFRKILSVSQFAAAQCFIIGALLVSSQIRFLLSKEMGFKTNGVVMIDTPFNPNQIEHPEPYYSKRELLLNKIKSLPNVKNACLSGSTPATNNYSVTTMKYDDGVKMLESSVEVKNADEDFFKLYQMPLVAGNYPKKSDSLIEFVINESLARHLGFTNPQEAVGKQLIKSNKPIPVVGVIKDYYFKSLHNPIKPLAFFSEKWYQTQIHVELDLAQGSGKDNLAGLEKEFKSIYPADGFDYTFTDQSIALFYEQEERISKLLRWATGVSILISCLGMLGLVIHTINQRRKEIGIRKVLGASVTQLVNIISSEFIKLVGIALLIASPLVYWFIHKWLQNFAYHTEIKFYLFIVGGLAMIGLAILTLSYQTIKVAHDNPVNSIRTE